MKALLTHAKKYRMQITGLSTRPRDITPEEIKEESQYVENCIVAFICVEGGDSITAAKDLSKEIVKMMNDTKETILVIAPFAHLSNKLAPSSLAIQMLDALCEELKKYKPYRTHFGSDKELMVDIFGHPGNVRFREF